MRKFLSLLLAMCLTFSLCMTSAAAVGNDATGDGSSDILNVRVPDEISLHMDQDGHVQVPQTLAIENLSAKAVRVESIHVEGKNGWSVVDWASDFSGKPADTKDLAMSFRGDGTDDVGDVTLSNGNWDISEGGSFLINAAVKMPMQAETDKTSIATVYWSIDWADDGSENPSGGFVVSVLPGENGSCDVNEITTGPDGKIPEFPGVTPDEGYLFDHWEDQDGNPVDENTVLDADDRIRPVFKPDPDWNPDKTVTVPVLPGENGSCDAGEITTGSDGKISEFPSVTPDEGYLFDHWEDQDGNPIDENTVLDADDRIRPVFKPDPDWNPDKTVTVPVLPGEHGSCDANEITTGSDGKISEFPGVTPDEGYLFDHWEDQGGDSVDENTILDVGDSIRPVFKPDPDWNPDKTVTVPVLDGEHGSCDAGEITTGSDGKISEFPGVTPDEGYLFDHWEDQDGNPVDENTVLGDGDSIRPVFKPDSDWNPDKTVTVLVLPGEHGSCDAGEITTGSDGKISEFPGVTPDEGYLFDYWEDQDGNPVDENTVLDDGDSIRPVFKVDDTNPSNGLVMSVADAKANGFTFASYEDGLEITGFENVNFSANIDIPEQIGDFKVLRVGKAVFKGQSNIKSISMPDTITSIGTEAFSGCGNLSKVVWSQRLKTISSTAFWRCASLTSIDFPDAVERIEQNAFGYCTSLVAVELPDSLTYLGCGAFAFDTALTGTMVFKNSLSVDGDSNNQHSPFIGIDGLNLVYDDGCLLVDGTMWKGDRFSVWNSDANRWEVVTVSGPKFATITIHKYRAGAYLDGARATRLDILSMVDGDGNPVDYYERRAFTFAAADSLGLPLVSSAPTAHWDDPFWGVKNLKTIYFNGTKAEWAALGMTSDELDGLRGVTIVCLPNPVYGIRVESDGRQVDVNLPNGEETVVALRELYPGGTSEYQYFDSLVTKILNGDKLTNVTSFSMYRDAYLRALQAKLDAVFGVDCVRVEHVGSTDVLSIDMKFSGGSVFYDKLPDDVTVVTD